MGKFIVKELRIKKLEEQVKQLEKELKEKDQEIKNIKLDCAEQFSKISKLKNVNDLGNKDVKIRKMAEVAKENRDVLLKSLLNDENKNRTTRNPHLQIAL